MGIAMRRVATGILVLIAVCLSLGAAAQEPAKEPVEAGAAPAASFGPLDLYLFHSPSCHTCQMIVALKPDMEKLNPSLRVILENNTATGATEKAEKLRKQAKISPESWGPSVAIYLGEGWPTDEGQALLEKLHVLLKDRVEIDAHPWRGDNVAAVAAQRGEIEIMQELRGLRPGRMFRNGLRDGVRFQDLALLLVLAGLLVMLGGASRRTAALGLSFWVGSLLVFAAQGLGALKGVCCSHSYGVIVGGNLALALVLGVAALAVALRRWRAYKAFLRESLMTDDEVLAVDQAPASQGKTEAGLPAASLTVPDHQSLRGPTVVGLLVGMILTFAVVTLAPPTATGVLGEGWGLGKVPDVILPLLHAYLLGATLPLLVLALLAWGLTAMPSLRRRVQEQPVEFRLAAFLLFLVMGVYLTVQGLSLLVDRLLSPG
jgi:hypothetical protein